MEGSGRKRGKAGPKTRTCKLTLAFMRNMIAGRRAQQEGENEFELVQVMVERLAGPPVASQGPVRATVGQELVAATRSGDHANVFLPSQRS